MRHGFNLNTDGMDLNVQLIIANEHCDEIQPPVPAVETCAQLIFKVLLFPFLLVAGVVGFVLIAVYGVYMLFIVYISIYYLHIQHCFLYER